jgi:hypothetical protein
MYRVPNGVSFDYKCGLYQQSHGQRCSHNHIDGLLATRFVLSCLQQRLHSPAALGKLKDRLRQLAEAETPQMVSARGTAATEAKLLQVRDELKRAERNLAFAETKEQFRAVATVLEELKGREKLLAEEFAEMRRRVQTPRDVEAEINAALELGDRLTKLAEDSVNLPLATEAIKLANLKLFVRFRPIQEGKRSLNKVAGGVVTLGAAASPVPLYEGPTSRERVKELIPRGADNVSKARGRRSPTKSEPQDSGGEGTSLGNVSRGDRI